MKHICAIVYFIVHVINIVNNSELGAHVIPS